MSRVAVRRVMAVLREAALVVVRAAAMAVLLEVGLVVRVALLAAALEGVRVAATGTLQVVLRVVA